MEYTVPNIPQAVLPRLARLSLLIGIGSLLACCTPPWQLFLGSVAAMLAYASKGDRPLSTAARVGLVLGILSIIISILNFACYMYLLQIADDPANAELVRQSYRQAQALFKYLEEYYLNGTPAN